MGAEKDNGYKFDVTVSIGKFMQLVHQIEVIEIYNPQGSSNP